ncbi:MAG: DUF2490 domain-containing protein, partial [Chitinophagaceae bacterium]
MRTILVALLLFSSLSAISQRSHFGTWNVITTRVTLSEKWGFYNELQLRSQSFYNDHFYHEVKGGVSYAINKNFVVLLGVGDYQTYTDGGNFVKPVTAHETRLWQQLTMNHYLERIKFEHRYRIEQRWFNTGYRNRFRYRLNTAVPLNHKKMGPKTFYLAAFNEIFLTNKPPYFERNRLFAGTGYQMSKHFTIQPGYVYQFDYRNNIGLGKHFFQLTLTIDINAHKSPNERIPG